MNNLIERVKAKTIGLIALAVTICFTVIACSGGGSTEAAAGISPEVAVDYCWQIEQPILSTS